MKRVAIVQARMGSTRLPGKVLAPLAGEPMLRRVMTRVSRARCVDEALVATTVQPEDDELASLCADWNLPVWRGSEEDVLDRYHGAADLTAADAVVRITADCPFIDPDVIDRVVDAYTKVRPQVDYASNVNPRRTYPRGLDVEVISRDALERAWREDDDLASREHVTPYIWRQPERFRLYNVLGGCDMSRYRWTVDVPEDLLLAQVVYDHFGHHRFAWTDVLALQRERPELRRLNAHVVQKSVPSAG
jgi:spore coat polysaccharide biosynthesis protein SpsF